MAGPKKDKVAGNATPVSDPTLTRAQQRAANNKAVMQGVLKKYGKGTIGTAEALASRGVPRISSGVFVLDYALGGGWPRGRMNIIWGGPSCSKTTLMLKMIADAQKRDAVTNKYLWEVEDQSEAMPMKVVFVDIEGTFDQNWAETIGVDVTNLDYVRPENSEQAADIVEALIRSASVDVIILDSIAMMAPQAEVQGQMTDQLVGLAARLNTKMFRKVTAAMNTAALSDKRLVPSLFVVNQVRCIDLDALICVSGMVVKAGDILVGEKIWCGPLGYKNVVDVSKTGDRQGRWLCSHRQMPFWVSDGHVQPVVRGGVFTEVRGSDVVPGDWLIFPDMTELISGENTLVSVSGFHPNTVGLDIRTHIHSLPEIVSPDFASWLGMWFADGSMGEYGGDCVVQFTENNKQRFDLVLNACDVVFGKGSFRDSHPSLRANSKHIYLFLKALGLERYGNRKTIPNCIMDSPLHVVREFLRGACFDSHAFKGSGFVWTCENKDAARQISLLLRRFGIFPGWTTGKLDGGVYLYITGSDAVLFSERIGFLEDKKSSVDFCVKDSARGKYDVVPHGLGLSVFKDLSKESFVTKFSYYQSFRQCRYAGLNFSRLGLVEMCERAGDQGKRWLSYLAGNRFAEVKKVIPEVREAIDIEVDGDSLYVADGVLTHNCKVGVMFGSPDTKPGGVSQDFTASTEVKVSGNQVKYFDPDDKKFPKWAEFGFKVAKNKVSMPKIEGDYCMALADDPDGSFKVGETIEKKAIIEFSEKLGVLTNEGKSWKYLDQEFKTKSAAVEYWMDDPQRFLVLKRTLLLKLCPKQ